MVSIPLSVIINLVKYPLPSPSERHELSAQFQTYPLSTSRWRGRSTSSYLLHQTSTFPPSTGSRPFCTFNKFKQFSNWVKVYVKYFNNMGNEDTGLLSENWLMEGVKSQNVHNSGFLQCRLMHCWENLEKFPITGRGGREDGGRRVDSFCLCCQFHCGRLLNLLCLGKDSSTLLSHEKQRSKAYSVSFNESYCPLLCVHRGQCRQAHGR